MALAAGTQLGRYEVVGLLATGGMGEVYRARDARLGRTVAIKVLPPALSLAPDRVRRFELEARAAGALDHPNVLQRLVSSPVSLGRARWTPDGKAIVFVGIGPSGQLGIFRQDFVPGRDTEATRRLLAGPLPEGVPESLGISPDGSRLAVAYLEQDSSLMLAEPVPGVAAPRIAEAVHGAHQARAVRGVADRLAESGDEDRQARFGHERARPGPVAAAFGKLSGFSQDSGAAAGRSSF